MTGASIVPTSGQPGSGPSLSFERELLFEDLRDAGGAVLDCRETDPCETVCDDEPDRDDDDRDDRDDGTERDDDSDDREREGPNGDTDDDRQDRTITRDTDDDVSVDGALYVAPGVSIDGNVEAGGDVELGAGAHVDGNIETRGNVTLAEDVSVSGNIEADGAITLGGATEMATSRRPGESMSGLPRASTATSRPAVTSRFVRTPMPTGALLGPPSRLQTAPMSTVTSPRRAELFPVVFRREYA